MASVKIESVIQLAQKAYQSIDISSTWSPPIQIAGYSLIFTIFMSFFLIGQHTIFYNKPEEQKWIICCVFIVPMYSTCSFLSLCNPEFDSVADLISSCYESFAIYSFCHYVIACLGGETRTIEKLQSLARFQPLLLISSSNDCRLPQVGGHWYMPKWSPGKDFYYYSKFGIAIYMIANVTFFAIRLGLEPWDIFGQGIFQVNVVYPYLTGILTISQCWALYCIYVFICAIEKYSVHFQPMAKFMCFKSVIIVTWWQSIGISLIASLQTLDPSSADLTVEFQNALQNFLVVIEMSAFSVWFMFHFPCSGYRSLERHDSRQVYDIVILDDIGSSGRPLDPQEVTANERESLRSFLTSHLRPWWSYNIGENIHDVVVNGAKFISSDVRDTLRNFRLRLWKEDGVNVSEG